MGSNVLRKVVSRLPAFSWRAHEFGITFRSRRVSSFLVTLQCHCVPRCSCRGRAGLKHDRLGVTSSTCSAGEGTQTVLALVVCALREKDQCVFCSVSLQNLSPGVRIRVLRFVWPLFLFFVCVLYIGKHNSSTMRASCLFRCRPSRHASIMFSFNYSLCIHFSLAVIPCFSLGPALMYFVCLFVLRVSLLHYVSNATQWAFSLSVCFQLLNALSRCFLKYPAPFLTPILFHYVCLCL